MGKVLFTPARLENWIVVDFALADPKLLQPFVEDLTRAMRERGQFCLHYFICNLIFHLFSRHG